MNSCQPLEKFVFSISFARIFTAALAIAACAITPALADNPIPPVEDEKGVVVDAGGPDLWDPSRPDSHAPIGVMGEHTHSAGEWMLSLRYMYMHMGQNYDGRDSISDRSVVSPTGFGYMVTPLEMNTQMIMAGGMYAPTDWLTLMLMVPYVWKDMDHLRRDGLTFTTKSEDWGDLKASALIRFWDGAGQRLHGNLGLSMPTGSIDERDFVPGPGETQLPYPMQIGSGTWDLLPGVTYLGQYEDWSWGAQALFYLPLESENSHGYRLGDRFNINAWLAYRFNDWLSASVRVQGSTWDDIKGRDRDLVIPAGAVPTADPSLRGGDRVDVFGGLNLSIREGLLRGHRFAVEAGGPVWQDLDGPQLGMDWMVTVGWQKAF